MAITMDAREAPMGSGPERGTRTRPSVAAPSGGRDGIP